MYISRSESHQHEKRKRKKKRRRLLAVNLMLLGAIIVLVGVGLSLKNAGSIGDLLSFGGNGTEIKSSDGGAAVVDKGGKGEDGGGSVQEENEGTSKNGEAAEGKPQDEGSAGGESEGETPVKNDPGSAGSGDNGSKGDNGSSSGGESGSSGEKIRLAFVGDILLASSVEDQLKRYGYDFPYAKSLLYLSEPDLTAGNLEYPVTEGGTPADDKEFVFKGSPLALPALRDAGFDVVNLANNHTLDHGVKGLFDTMSHLDEAGISHIGAGKDDIEAFTPVIKESRGIKIAYIGLSRVVPKTSWKADKNTPGVAETYDTTRAKAAIAKAKEQADLVVVMVHWGKERVDTPEQYQRNFAREYIDSGADLVIGSHPHVLQGFEKYKGKWIAYSLGNFIFSVYPKGKSGETGVLDATCTAKGDCDLQFHPMYADQAQPKPMEENQAQALIDRLTSISFKVKLRKDGTLVSE
ncbi:CapA family protein [Paenibacillus gorillae]|uniref:CapA family protein n=1 Tax=Paenibacillus gorillae TaxID=1243662 RepID=UPI0004AD76FC|nr:CapA family protein [Paenibacillus gorillae]